MPEKERAQDRTASGPEWCARCAYPGTTTRRPPGARSATLRPSEREGGVAPAADDEDRAAEVRQLLVDRVLDYDAQQARGPRDADVHEVARHDRMHERCSSGALRCQGRYCRSTLRAAGSAVGPSSPMRSTRSGWRNAAETATCAPNDLRTSERRSCRRPASTPSPRRRASRYRRRRTLPQAVGGRSGTRTSASAASSTAVGSR